VFRANIETRIMLRLAESPGEGSRGSRKRSHEPSPLRGWAPIFIRIVNSDTRLQ
jgi:hypothetical protein